MHFRTSILCAVEAAAILSLVGCSTPSPKEAGSGGTAGSGSGGESSGGTAGHAAGGQSAGGTAGMTAAAGTSSGTAGAPAVMNVDCSTFTGATPAPTFCNFKWVLKNSPPPCAGAAPCHGVGGGGINPLELPMNNDAALMQTLETVMSPDCGNIPIIKPNDSANSAMVKVLKGPCSTTVPQMPYGCDPSPDSFNCIPANYVSAIEQWIQAGAKLE